MPSNKQRDILKKQLEKTGKNQIVFYSAAIVPVIKKDVVTFKIMKIGFTSLGECVTIEEVAKARDESTALLKLQMELHNCGATDLKTLRQLVKQVKEDYNAKKATKQSADQA
jgi:hypothetical protein